jgi:hypothetical protein
VQLGLSFSHYSPRRLRDCQVEWRLVGDGLPSSCCGRLGPFLARPGGVIPAGVVEFTVPELAQAVCARLELHLLDHDGVQASSTFQELYLFPAIAPQAESGGLRSFGGIYAPGIAATLGEWGYPLSESLEEAGIAVSGVLDDTLRDYLLGGGRVLWLAETDDALQTNLAGLDLKPRRGHAWQGDWASSLCWLRPGWLTEGLPVGRVVDFAFAGLTPVHVLTGFAPHEFALDVYAGLFVGWLHKPAALVAHRRYGRGRLLACTFRLGSQLDTNPLAGRLVTNLLGALAG